MAPCMVNPIARFLPLVDLTQTRIVHMWQTVKSLFRKLRRSSVFRPALKCRVVLNTKTDQAFEGVLWKAKASYVILKDAHLVAADGTKTPIQGEVIVDTDNVDFLVKTVGS